MKVLVTGAAGFIGSTLAHRLLDAGHIVVGLDNLNDYYDVSLKEARTSRLTSRPNFKFVRQDIVNQIDLFSLFAAEKFERVAHLAAQAGVRYSVTNPEVYVQANVVGYLNVLEACRHHSIEHLIYASTSSVYGLNTHLPFSTRASTDHPVSLYGATKKANELFAHSYSHLYGLPTTGLRFFTVYGPWGRPDMALFLFAKNILAGKPIEIFNNGKHVRDFTYIDDVVEGIFRVIEQAPPQGDREWNSKAPNSASSSAPYRVYNIGGDRPVELMHYIGLLERCLGKTSEKIFLPMQKGDVPTTRADVSDLERVIGYRPETPIEVGIERFVNWYRDYYKA